MSSLAQRIKLRLEELKLNEDRVLSPKNINSPKNIFKEKYLPSFQLKDIRYDNIKQFESFLEEYQGDVEVGLKLSKKIKEEILAEQQKWKAEEEEYKLLLHEEKKRQQAKKVRRNKREIVMTEEIKTQEDEGRTVEELKTELAKLEEENAEMERESAFHDTVWAEVMSELKENWQYREILDELMEMCTQEKAEMTLGDYRELQEIDKLLQKEGAKLVEMEKEKRTIEKENEELQQRNKRLDVRRNQTQKLIFYKKIK